MVAKMWYQHVDGEEDNKTKLSLPNIVILSNTWKHKIANIGITFLQQNREQTIFLGNNSF